MEWLKSLVRRIIAKAMRPGFAEINARLSRIEAYLAGSPATENQIGKQPKYEEELNYWHWLVKEGGSVRDFGAPFEKVFYQWQRERLEQLSEALGLADPAEIDEWCSRRSVIEIGAGPYPAIATAQHGWRRAVAVDPLARAYSEKGLLPDTAANVVYIESPGENIPLPENFADIVINENCLDHVSVPELVVSEMLRLLKPGGFLWLFVDLSNHVDNMHPHAMNENKVRKFLNAFELIHENVSDHHAHPEGYGSYRGLLRKPRTDVDFAKGGGHLLKPNVNANNNGGYYRPEAENGCNPLMHIFSQVEVASLSAAAMPKTDSVELKHNVFFHVKRPLLFSFVCEVDELARIDLMFGTYERNNPGRVIFRLWDDADPATCLREVPLKAYFLQDNSFAAFEFAPVSGSRGKTFYITLNLQEGVEDFYPGLWYGQISPNGEK
ncbi:MAG: class I SAM-dependent methyltransferase [Gammaproteobacteria bacterium]|nr:class I SAM-dependent methyltransferase [Gammaproteobacteria bacterium]